MGWKAEEPTDITNYGGHLWGREQVKKKAEWIKEGNERHSARVYSIQNKYSQTCLQMTEIIRKDFLWEIARVNGTWNKNSQSVFCTGLIWVSIHTHIYTTHTHVCHYLHKVVKERFLHSLTRIRIQNSCGLTTLFAVPKRWLYFNIKGMITLFL